MSAAAEIRHLRAELARLLSQARENQRIMQRHQALDLCLISAGSLGELLIRVFVKIQEISELAVVTLALVDTDYGIRRIMAELAIPLSRFPQLLFFDEEQDALTLQNALETCRLGPYQAALHGPLFPAPAPVPVSVAIVPLMRNAQRIGFISFGSLAADRFTKEMATDFIDHLASVLALCIDNVMHHERLKYIGLIDPLTGVNNRRYVERRLREEVGRIDRQGCPLACLYIDVDHFKSVNDLYGHQTGDDVLREIANRIQAELRLSDALGRFGGEEFLALLIDTNGHDALLVAERIRHSIAQGSIRSRHDALLSLSVSIGVATLSAPLPAGEPDQLAQQLVAQADQYLYQAKMGGRNRVIGE